MDQQVEASNDLNKDDHDADELDPATPPILLESPQLSDSFVQMINTTAHDNLPVNQEVSSQEPVVLNEDDMPDNGNGDLDTSTPPILLESPPLTASLIQMIGGSEQPNMSDDVPSLSQQNEQNTDSNGFEYVESMKISSLDSINKGPTTEEVPSKNESVEPAPQTSASNDESAQGSGDTNVSSVNKATEVALEMTVEPKANVPEHKESKKQCPWDCIPSYLPYISIGVAILAGLTYIIMKKRV